MSDADADDEGRVRTTRRGVLAIGAGVLSGGCLSRGEEQSLVVKDWTEDGTNLVAEIVREEEFVMLNKVPLRVDIEPPVGGLYPDAYIAQNTTGRRRSQLLAGQVVDLHGVGPGEHKITFLHEDVVVAKVTVTLGYASE